MSKPLAILMAKIWTVLLATLFLYAADEDNVEKIAKQGKEKFLLADLNCCFGSLRKELPSLTREKRLSETLAEPDENAATKNKVEEGSNRLVHTNVDGSHSYPPPEIHVTQQNASHKSHRGHYENREQKIHSVQSSKTNGKVIVHSRLNKGQHHKIILPKVKFGWLSQQLPRPPPPSEEMLHRIRMRMKRKKRRRLRELKRISKSEAYKQQTYGGKKKASEQSKSASVNQRLKSAHNETQAKSPTSFSSSDNRPKSSSDSSSSKSIEENKLKPSKQLHSSQQSEALANSHSSSSLQRPKRIPLNGDDNAETNRFSSLEITLRSKLLTSLHPESPSPSKDATESSLSSKLSLTQSSSSLDDTQAEDILRSFFKNAGSAGNLEKAEEGRPPRNNIADKPSQEPRWRPGQGYAKETRQQKRDQGNDDYELKLLEFQKKAIEEEEKRLKDQFEPERKNIKVSKQSTVEQLDQENDEKGKEIQLLFDKFTKINKENSNDDLKENALNRNGVKRSFGVNVNNDDLDDGEALQTKLSERRKRRKIPKSNDKGMIEKERIINAGGDSGNDDDEITEMAFYDKNDDMTNQNQDVNEKSTVGKQWDMTGGNKQDGMKDRNSFPTNSDNKETAMLEMKKRITKKPKDLENHIELDEPVLKLSSGIEGKPLQNNKEQKAKGRPEDLNDNEDLMKNKLEEGENGWKAQANNVKQTTKLQNIKKEGNQGSDNDGVEIEVVSDSPNPPIFTEIKDEGQKSNDKKTANEKEGELLDTEKKKEMANYDVPDSMTNDNNNKINNNNSNNNNSNSNNNNNNNNNKDNSNTSSRGDSRNGDIINNNNKNKVNNNNNKVNSNPSTGNDSRSSADNNSKSSSEQNIDNDDVMLHDNRLMYILTGEGAKPSTKAAENNKDVKEIRPTVKVTDIHDGTDKNLVKQMKNKKPLVQKHIIINKELQSKIKEMHDRILNAHNRVSRELEQMEQELSTKFNTLQESMSMAKKLTTNVDSKINDSVLSVMKLATSSAKQAKTKLTLVQKAAAALKNIEEKIGANETRNFAKILRYKLPDLSVEKRKTYQKILALNNVITKMDGARLIALDKANTSYTAKAKLEDSLSKVAGNVLDELKSTERELNDDTEMEIEDEIEADRKIRDAKTRNHRAAVKTAQALQNIEGYLKQLENDENRLRNLDN